MSLHKADLQKTYESLNTQELLTMHASGGLTDEAYEVLELLLDARNIPIPERPTHSVPIKHHRGKVLTPIKWLALVGFLAPVISVLLMSTTDIELFHNIAYGLSFLWPTFAVLFIMGEGFLAMTVSVVLNVIIWSALGWVIGVLYESIAGRVTRKSNNG